MDTLSISLADAISVEESESTTTPSAMPTAGEHFEQWLFERSTSTRDRLTPDAARPYRYIWIGWQKWLDAPRPHLQPCPWQAATSLHVWTFLQHGIDPCSSRNSQRIISEITRRRYWRVLDTLYEAARVRQLLPENPARTFSEPRPQPERSAGQVFHPLQIQAVREALPEPQFVWDIRDRAILLVLLDAALTTSEICTLQVSQVLDHLTNVALRLDGPRAAQDRILRLGPQASKALKEWMVQRRGLPQSESMPQQVFFSQRDEAMSPRALFHLVSTTVRRAFAAQHLDLPNHIGPQVLRNSRLVMWLNEGMDPEEVVYRAGFKDERSFRGLVQHLQAPELRSRSVADHEGLARLNRSRSGSLNPSCKASNSSTYP